MKKELYQWIKNIAVFYILFTTVLHLVPDKKYERYIRSFMGLLLIYICFADLFLQYWETVQSYLKILVRYFRKSSSL